jgi:XTP/dITP diphosphohydrolase
MQNRLQKKMLLATNNPGKLGELKALLAGLREVELASPADLGIHLEVRETGKTYTENAILKAKAFAAESGLVSLADDSGLEVDALEGAPGLYSARYSPKPGATDADRRAYLLENLSGKERPWRARFRAAIAVAVPGGDVYTAEGVCEGQIIPQERGGGGFGYDPIFLLAGYSKTMAELDEEEKNRVSHRARAVRNGWGLIERALGEVGEN